jgi:hypothetical protein
MLITIGADAHLIAPFQGVLDEPRDAKPISTNHSSSGWAN